MKLFLAKDTLEKPQKVYIKGGDNIQGPIFRGGHLLSHAQIKVAPLIAITDK